MHDQNLEVQQAHPRTKCFDDPCTRTGSLFELRIHNLFELKLCFLKNYQFLS